MIGALARPIAAVVLSKFVSQSLGALLARPNQKDLDVLRELAANGQLTPVIDRRYGLSEVAEAIRYLEQGHARGKVVVTCGT
jgi:NADPH:quinone reductase-like Zn-dependent oxidoreductase